MGKMKRGVLLFLAATALLACSPTCCNERLSLDVGRLNAVREALARVGRYQHRCAVLS